MIVPFFRGLPGLRRFVAWCLVFLNIFFYFSFEKEQAKFDQAIGKLYEDSYYLQIQGKLFSEIIDQHPLETTKLLKSISYKALRGHRNSQKTLGELAFRNSLFKKYAAVMPYHGDVIQYQYWKKKYQALLETQAQDPSYILGMTQEKSNLRTYITYQFTHGGIVHLASNIWFLLIFGAFVEKLFGAFNFLIFYLVSGVVAAKIFLLLSLSTEAPLIGASGSISGLMGLVLVLYWKKGIRCFYWLMPKQGYYGFAKFPAWIVLLFWISSDIAGYWGTLSELGGVAHAAHIGGFAFGCFTGFVIRLTQWGQNLFASYSR